MMPGSKKLAALRGELAVDTAAKKRLSYLFDDGSYQELDALAKMGEALTGVVTAYGYVGGSPVYAFSQDSSVKGGAVGKAHAAKICKLLELAAKTGTPVVGIHDSNGAFLDGGVEALAGYSEMLMWTGNLSGVVPQITVVAGTCAGSAAMIACSSDFTIMTEKSELFLAPPFDTAKTKNAGSAKNAALSGTAHLVCKDDKAAVESARKLLSMLPMNNLSPIPVFDYSVGKVTAKEGTSLAAAELIADAGSVMEISESFGSAAFTALATVAGSTVGLVGTAKSGEGRLTREDCAKIARFVRTCDAFTIPVVTLVDSEGFSSDADGELAGAIRDFSKVAHVYAEATTAKLAIVTGKAYGPIYVAFAGKNAGADMTLAFPDGIITPLAPETAVEFLNHDALKGAADVNAKRKELADIYAEEECSVFIAAAKNYLDQIVLPEEARDSVISALQILAGKRASRLPKKHSNMPF